MATAEVTILTKLAWGFAVFLIGICGWFLKRFASQSDEKHAGTSKEIREIHKSIELIEKATIASDQARELITRDIERLKIKVSEMEDIGTELQTALKVEEALKKREEMDALKQMMKAAGHDNEKKY